MVDIATIDADAREWLVECYPDSEDDILEGTDTDTILRIVATEYDGGINGFCAATYGRMYYLSALDAINEYNGMGE